MTPETYMKRFHGCGCASFEREGDFCPLSDDFLRNRDRDRDRDCGRDRDRTCRDDLDDNCCCKASMVEGLRLLCGENLARLVDFNAFFFLTDSLAVGSALAAPGTDTDNITTPNASLERFSPCNCDLLDVSGTAYFAVPDTQIVALPDVDQLSLCALKAVAFQIETSECEECEDSNFRRAVRAIRRAIRAEGGDTGACGACEAHCDCDDCCCAAGIIRELSTRNLSRLATLTVGPLVLRNVTVLGSIGSVLVLASEELNRIYLVCANAVEAIG